MLSTTIASSVLILSLALVRRLFRGRLNLRLQYALWLLVAARLLLPLPSVQSSVNGHLKMHIFGHEKCTGS